MGAGARLVTGKRDSGNRWRLPSVLVTRFKIRESGYGKA
jgi:hypothetical protein